MSNLIKVSLLLEKPNKIVEELLLVSPRVLK